MITFTEKEIQNTIIELIKREQFLNSIQQKNQLDIILKHDTDPTFSPGFQIDFLLRTLYTRSAKRVLNSLEEVQIISGEKIKNISLQTDTKSHKERLYPDIVLGNAEDSSFMLLELKKDTQTEREAITELMAYALELKNHLPNIADGDIHLVIISTHFNTLLDHAISSLLLGTKFNILALHVNPTSEQLQISIHFPDSWTDISQNDFPEHALSSFTIVPYNYNKEKNNSKIPQNHIIYNTVEDIIMFEAAKANSHGFFIIWENKSEYGLADFCITLYQINPFAFLQSALNKGFHLNTQEPLSKYILTQYTEGSGFNTMKSLEQIAKTVGDFLDQYFNTGYEDFSSWTKHMQPYSNFRSQAKPIHFNAWGNIGEYIRYLFFHPSSKNVFISEQQQHDPLYYRSPIYGIETINRISGLTLFKDGIFRSGVLYKYAKQLREHLQIASVFYEMKKANEDIEFLTPMLFYSGLDLISSQREIQYRIFSSTKKFTPITSLNIYLENVHEEPEPNIFGYLKWFINSFLDGDPFYQDFFEKSFNWCMVFSDSSCIQLPKNKEKELIREISLYVRGYLTVILSSILIHKNIPHYKDEILEYITDLYFGNILPAFQTEIDILEKVERIPTPFIINTFESHFLEILNMTKGELFHPLTPLSENFHNIDWDKLQNHLVKRFEEGEKYGCIFIAPNGGVSIGVLNENMRYLEEIKDPFKEVFILQNISGMGSLTRSTWEKVKSGKAFKG